MIYIYNECKAEFSVYLFSTNATTTHLFHYPGKMNLSSRCMVLALGLLASSSSTMAGGDMKLLSRSKQAFEFERAMKMGVQKSKQERNLKAKLNEKLLEKAVFVPPTKTEPEFMTENAGRKLANYYGGDDQYYGFGFDISTYSLKYTQCQAISTWSDELAEDEDSESVLRTQRFALFRLCPSDICSADNQYGCSYNYGEYILDMADYLEAMQQYTAERFEAFCEFCEECMEENDDAGAAADDGGNNGYYAAADDAAANDGYYAAAGDDAAADDGAGNNNGYYSSCAYYTQCSNYANVCEAQDADDVIDYEDFFECQMFEGSNGKELYLGPHCGSDGRSIGIGLYYDDMCTQYAGKDYDIQSFTGMTFDDEALSAYYDTECVSCLESVSLQLFFFRFIDVTDNPHISILFQTASFYPEPTIQSSSG